MVYLGKLFDQTKGHYRMIRIPTTERTRRQYDRLQWQTYVLHFLSHSCQMPDIEQSIRTRILPHNYWMILHYSIISQSLISSTYSLHVQRVTVSPDHTRVHTHTRQDSPGQRISPPRRPLPVQNTTFKTEKVFSIRRGTNRNPKTEKGCRPTP